MTKRIFGAGQPFRRVLSAALVSTAALAGCIGLMASTETPAGRWSMPGAKRATAILWSLPFGRLTTVVPGQQRPARAATFSEATAQASAAAILTDKTGYFAHETAVVTGSGFAPGEIVTLRVVHADGTAEAGMGHEPFVAAADEAGNLAAEWSIGSHEGAAQFALSAEGPSSGAAPAVAFERVAAVQTDKFDYRSGESAFISGEGFLPGEVVRVKVAHSNGLNDGAGHLPYEVTADSYGKFAMSWYVNPDDSLGAILRVTATGAASGLVATTTFTDPPLTFVDDGGADDVNGQKDVNSMMVDYTLAPGKIAVAWNWDDTDWTGGGNTGDGCALFDTNGNGFANYALCVTVAGSPATFQSLRLFSCGDTSAVGCTSQVQVPPGSVASTATASVVSNSDPFGVSTSPYFTASHVTGNKCGNTPGCRTADTVANVTVALSDVGGAAAKLTNVCVYSSQSLSSNTSDCVAAPNSGFLTIKKTTVTDSAAQLFSFTTSRASQNGTSSFSQTVTGSQTDAVIASNVTFAAGPLDLSETVPADWDLTSAACTVQSSTPASTGTPNLATGTVAGVSIQAGLETVCAFTNTKRMPKISVTKSATPATYSNVGVTITYNYTVTNTGNVTLSGVSLSDDKLGAIAGCAATTLAAGGSTTCSATYTTTQSDIDAGSITNVATATGTNNGQTYSATATKTVTSTCEAPAGVTISPGGAVSRFVGDSFSLTASVSSGTPPLHYSWKKDGNSIPGAPDSSTYSINAVVLGDSGTYTVVVSNACGAGTQSSNSAALTVNKLTTGLTVTAATGTYGGNTAAALSATLTTGGNGVAGKTVDFTLNGTNVGSATTNASGVATLPAPSSLVGINAGSYPTGVGASFAGDSTYAGQTASNALTVAKAILTVTADPKSKVYDGQVFPAFTSTISGFVNGETETALRGSGALAGAAGYGGPATSAVNANATPYVITPILGTLSATNYDFTFVSGGLTITPRPVTATADAQSKIYGDADPTLTYQVTSGSVISGDVFTGALTRAGGENVGTYPITQGTLALNANYTLTFAGANLIITPRLVTVTADAKTKVYGNADPALTYQITSGTLAAGDAFSGGLTRNAGETVGSYAIQQGTLALNTNYTLSFVGATLAITPRPLTITANNLTKTYGVAVTFAGTEFTTNGLVSGDSVASVTLASAGAPATATVTGSPYPIVPSAAAGTGLTNYTIGYVNGSLTINKAPLTVTATAVPLLMNYPSYPILGVAYSGFVNGETPAVLGGALVETVFQGVTAVATAPLTAALPPGSYLVTPGGLTSANYGITFAGTTFTVGNAAPIITTVSGPAPTAVGSGGTGSATLNVTFTDFGLTGDTFTFASTWTLGGGGTFTTAGTLTGYNAPAGGGLGTGTGTITGTGLVPGVYSVVVTVTDKFNATSDPYEYHYVVIYDPAGGFVTGGGWIDSPSGACQPGVVPGVCTADVTGRANFGFVSKYKKGQQAPDGNTEFQFQAGNLNFKSTSYEWLVISGTTQAQFKGSGAINGAGDYGFILTAVDGDNFGNKKPDSFRIKIWDKATSAVVYDNQLGADETSLTAATVLSGGSIVIHSK